MYLNISSSYRESYVTMSSRTRRQAAIERTRELQNTVEHWDKDVGQNCNEFIRGNIHTYKVTLIENN